MAQITANSTRVEAFKPCCSYDHGRELTTKWSRIWNYRLCSLLHSPCRIIHWQVWTQQYLYMTGAPGGCRQHTLRAFYFMLLLLLYLQQYTDWHSQTVFSVNILQQRCHASHVFTQTPEIKYWEDKRITVYLYLQGSHRLISEICSVEMLNIKEQRFNCLDYSTFICEHNKEKLGEEFRCKGWGRIITSEGRRRGRREC